MQICSGLNREVFQEDCKICKSCLRKVNDTADFAESVAHAVSVYQRRGQHRKRGTTLPTEEDTQRKRSCAARQQLPVSEAADATVHAVAPIPNIINLYDIEEPELEDLQDAVDKIKSHPDLYRAIKQSILFDIGQNIASLTVTKGPQTSVLLKYQSLEQLTNADNLLKDIIKEMNDR